MGEHHVASIDDLSPDRGLVVEADGRSIGLFLVGDEVHAILNVCPHQGGPVGSGGLFPAIRAVVEDRRLREFEDPESPVVVCPWHGWEFDVRSGVCLADAKRRVQRYPVVLRNGDVIVTLPDRPGANGGGPPDQSGASRGSSPAASS